MSGQRSDDADDIVRDAVERFAGDHRVLLEAFAEAEHVALNRASWNQATLNHNSHKGDQAEALRRGEDPLFPEELELLGDLDGVSVAHLQCNAGQDSLGLALRGAAVTGIDLSDTAIEFARELSGKTGIPATFVRDEILSWTHATDERFDVAFASYGVLGWNRDLGAWMRGAHRVLKPGGRLVIMEFHPVVWSLGQTLALTGDDYFAPGPFAEPVSDYVAETLDRDPLPNEHVAHGFQHSLAEIVQAVVDAGLQLRTLREYPHSNYARLSPGLVAGPDRTWVFPQGKARIPLMFGLVADRPTNEA